MKTYIYIIITLISLSTFNTNAQDIFLGTWEHQEGNEIFRITLWQDAEDSTYILGHYEKVQFVNGIETYIYSSDKEVFIGNNDWWLTAAIATKDGNNEKIAGTFTDNTVNGSLYKKHKVGYVEIEILTNSGGLNPTITAHWKVERKSYQGLIINEAPEFSVPTDIILTKVN